MNHNYLLEFQQEENTTPKHTPNTVYITELNSINKEQMHSPKFPNLTDNSRKSIPHRTPSYQPQVASKAWLFLLIQDHKTKEQEEFSKKSHLLDTEKYTTFSYIKESISHNSIINYLLCSTWLILRLGFRCDRKIELRINKRDQEDRCPNPTPQALLTFHGLLYMSLRE